MTQGHGLWGRKKKSLLGSGFLKQPFTTDQIFQCLKINPIYLVSAIVCLDRLQNLKHTKLYSKRGQKPCTRQKNVLIQTSIKRKKYSEILHIKKCILYEDMFYGNMNSNFFGIQEKLQTNPY